MHGLLSHPNGLLPVRRPNPISLAVSIFPHSFSGHICPRLVHWLAPAPSEVVRCTHIAQAKPSEQEQLQAESTSSSLQQTDSSNDSSQGGVNRLLVLGGLVAAAVAILVAAGGLGGLKDKVHDLEDLIEASGYLGPLIYAGAYTASTVLLFPASVLTLAAGYLFGELMLLGNCTAVPQPVPCYFFNMQS